MEESGAYAFLFDRSVEGVPEPQLAFFTGSLLAALSQADPQGQTQAQLRLGLPLLEIFSEHTSAVRGDAKSSGRTTSHDIGTYKYVIWDWLDSLDLCWSSIERENGEKIFRTLTGECISISSLSNSVRDAVDKTLRDTLGYIGGFQIDPGNPVHSRAFFDYLLYPAAIVGGSIVQERSIEGDEDWPLEGADRFHHAGLVWKDFGWLASEGPMGLPRVGFSDRGARTAAAVSQKQTPTIERRVIEEIERNFLLNNDGKVFEFQSIGSAHDVLQAIMPEGKFTKYLFSRNHKDGGSKAAFLIDKLGIDPNDWRYVAAQFYRGLLLSRLERLKFNKWETGYGVRFDVQMRIQNRSGQKAVIVTGWNMNPGKLPSLSTAFPGDRDADVIEPGDPPILHPGLKTSKDWSQLWNWANAAGIHAAESVVPTPMYLVGFAPVSDGECGTAAVRIPDARTGLARWLVQNGQGKKSRQGGAVVFSPVASQSIDRAAAWARSAALILRLNGLNTEFETYSD